ADAARALAAFARHAPFDVLAHDPRSAPPRPDALDPCMSFEITDRDAAHAFVTSPPAARFAIETALLDALAREHRVSIAMLLAPFVERLHARGEASSVASGDAGAEPSAPGHGVRHVGADPSSPEHEFPHAGADPSAP